MCRIHIKTVREIRREEYVIQENSAPALDFGGFVQWVLDDFPEPWTPDTVDTIPPLPPLFTDGGMQLTGGIPTPATVGLNLTNLLFSPSALLNGVAQQLQLQTGAASHQSQGGSQDPSEQPQTGMNEFQVQEMTGFPVTPQEDGGHNQQPVIGMNWISQQPQLNFGEIHLPSVGSSGFFQQFPESTSTSSQESLTVNPGSLLQASIMESFSLPLVIGGFSQQSQTGTNEPSQQSQANLDGILPNSGSTTEFFQLQAAPSGLFQQPDGDAHGPSQQTHVGVGGPFHQSFTSGLSVPQTGAGGPLQQLETSIGGLPPLPGWDGFLQHTHLGPGGLHHTQGNSHELSLQYQPHASVPSQPLYGNMGGIVLIPGSLTGFSQQPQSGPSESSQQPQATTGVFSQQSHPSASVLSYHPHVGMAGLPTFTVAFNGHPQQLQVNMNGPSEPSEVSNHGTSQPSEAHVGEHSYVPSASTGLFFLPPSMNIGGILQDLAGMNGSSLQPGNTEALFQQSLVTTAGHSQQSQASGSETSQQLHENTSENAQELQTDTGEVQMCAATVSKESQADMRDF